MVNYINQQRLKRADLHSQAMRPTSRASQQQPRMPMIVEVSVRGLREGLRTLELRDWAFFSSQHSYVWSVLSGRARSGMGQRRQAPAICCAVYRCCCSARHHGTEDLWETLQFKLQDPTVGDTIPRL